MNNKIQVSIIMSCYNTEKFLAESIESILNQTFKDFEFIIIDDKSTDNSLNIAKQYAKKDSRIIIIENQINSGAAFSRNAGFKIAKGKYIAILDSDDIALAHRIETQYSFLEKNTHIYAVGSSYSYINTENIILYNSVLECNLDKNNMSIDDIIKNVHKIHNPTVMFRNEHKYFYRENLRICEDRDMWLRMISDNHSLYLSPELLNHYRIHETSLINGKNYDLNMYVNIVDKWFQERITHGYDNYNSFDFSKIKTIQPSIKGIAYTQARNIKLFFIQGYLHKKQIRLLIYTYWKTHGFFIWKPSFIIYLCSFTPFTANLLRKIIIKKEKMN